ncbi:SHOCT domain-containing protein [Kitasatospora sp. NPDC056138]|uniref:SHOCT domain-containing protein n=1 Tax=Kitasatospora sp. NPDC056138 TaxID=3345724 RepID=UPI0035E09A15
MLNAVPPAVLPLADHGRWNGPGPGPWLLLIPLFWLALILLVVLVLRRAVRRRRCAAFGDSPLAVLGRRYAQGEIDADEYRARREVLSEQVGRRGGGTSARGKQP